MKVPTHRQFGLFGLGLIALVNAIALGGVAWNRSHVDSRLALTERELSVPLRYTVDDEDGGVALTINWLVAPDPKDAGDAGTAAAWMGYGYARTPAWLDSAKLSALGFPATPPGAALARTPRERDRPAWLVLELDGPAYRRHVAAAERAVIKANATFATTRDKRDQDALTQATEVLSRARGEDSRLFVVDAGRDEDALRAQYPDRAHYAIVQGIVSATWMRSDTRQWRMEGSLDRLRVPQLQLSRAQIEALGAAARPRLGYDEQPGKPFFAVLATGRRGEPWIESLGPR